MKAADLVALIDSMAVLPYGGEAVDQRAHSLQCAEHARAAGADSELVAACALHDVGRCPPVRRMHRGVPHEHAGALFLGEVCGPRVAWLVGAHVDAKRYLVGDDPSYATRLSRASVRSLRVQGGPMGAAACEAFAAHPWHHDALRLRQWDEASKDPAGTTCDPGVLEAALARVVR